MVYWSMQRIEEAFNDIAGVVQALGEGDAAPES